MVESSILKGGHPHACPWSFLGLGGFQQWVVENISSYFLEPAPTTAPTLRRTPQRISKARQSLVHPSRSRVGTWTIIPQDIKHKTWNNVVSFPSTGAIVHPKSRDQESRKETRPCHANVAPQRQKDLWEPEGKGWPGQAAQGSCIQGLPWHSSGNSPQEASPPCFHLPLASLTAILIQQCQARSCASARPPGVMFSRTNIKTTQSKESMIPPSPRVQQKCRMRKGHPLACLINIVYLVFICLVGWLIGFWLF